MAGLGAALRRARAVVAGAAAEAGVRAVATGVAPLGGHEPMADGPPTRAAFLTVRAGSVKATDPARTLASG